MTSAFNPNMCNVCLAINSCTSKYSAKSKRTESNLMSIAYAAAISTSTEGSRVRKTLEDAIWGLPKRFR